ncbi:MAG TPA: methyltransferase domain-containing protein [Pirellulaceae bacterium]|nr:methyltransferase domain-containing protein [Pirellulaceae bacterium]
MTQLTNAQLLDELRALRPWHHDIQLTEDVSTGMAYAAGHDHEGDDSGEDERGTVSLRSEYLRQLREIYPQGLSGKRLIDCACNAGGYCFWARELDIEYAFGFDIREHWIKQARFVQSHRQVFPTDRLEFAVQDLYKLPELGLEPFDICIFKGIFYHLPDPITGLKMAADLTRELLILNTQTTWGLPDGYLKPGREDVEQLMSGAYGLNWRPTGPRVLAPVLKWLGFKHARLVFYQQNPKVPELGRMSIFAARKPGLLNHLSGIRFLFRNG